ncbi:hypothetical protein FRN31_22245 [Vibrio alginolyticus]|nr:hypothetical protein [Vibrio alginolyticus]
MEYNDFEFEIQPNVNCPNESGFLNHKIDCGVGRLCVGDYRMTSEGFEVCVDKLPDEDGSDSWLVGTVPTLEEAKSLLWEHRYHAIG